MVAVVAGVVAITMAARRMLIQIPQRTMARGRHARGGEELHSAAHQLGGRDADHLRAVGDRRAGRVRAVHAATSTAQRLRRVLPARARVLYYLLSAILIVFFTYFYTSIIFNPIDLAENLKKQGGFIPGVKPGAKTAEYIDHVVSRITLPGALFLTFDRAAAGVDRRHRSTCRSSFGGTSLLIVVGVALDTMAQMQQHLLLRKYDGFMKKGRVRFRGRQAGGIYEVSIGASRQLAADSSGRLSS